LKLNELEKRRLLSYASHSIRDQLHWGDGEIIIPEEQILQQKITETEDRLTLDFEQLKLLTHWFLDATDEGMLLLGEDISILNKIIGQLTLYHNELKRKYDIKLRMLKAQLDAAEKVLTKLTRIVPKTGEKVDVDGTQDESVLNENIEKIVPKTEEKVVVEGEQDDSVLNKKIEKISHERREVEEYRKELIDKFQEERVDKQHGEIGEQRIELEEEQKAAKFEKKVKRAKELKKEMQKAEEITKGAKRKTKGKKLF
jgi:hypothetical protein